MHSVDVRILWKRVCFLNTLVSDISLYRCTSKLNETLIINQLPKRRKHTLSLAHFYKNIVFCIEDRTRKKAEKNNEKNYCMLSDCAISGHMVNVQPKQQQLKNATNQPTNQLKHDELLYTSPKQTKGRNKKKQQQQNAKNLYTTWFNV